MERIAAALLEIARRYPREYESPYVELIRFLEAASSGSAPELRTLEHAWPTISEQAVSQVHWVALLFPRAATDHPELLSLLKKMSNRHYTPPDRRHDVEAASCAWVDEQASALTEGALMHGLLHELAVTDEAQVTVAFLGAYYAFRDLLYGHLVNPEWSSVQAEVFSILYEQRLRWPGLYSAGYAYQGWGRIGIGGAKPTEERLRRYAVDELIDSRASVLDIGTNTGFVALELAAKAQHVTGIELNPYLIAVANKVKDAMQIRNAEFGVADFLQFSTSDRYDVVLSLANHATIDGNLVLGFDEYIAKIFYLLRPQGVLLFESHNVFGLGHGGAGDDGDFDWKMDIAAPYFEVIKYRMTRTFMPGHDPDRLFVAWRRRDRVDPRARRSFDLATALTRYAYSG